MFYKHGGAYWLSNSPLRRDPRQPRSHPSWTGPDWQSDRRRGFGTLTSYPIVQLTEVSELGSLGLRSLPIAGDPGDQAMNKKSGKLLSRRYFFRRGALLFATGH